MIDRYDQIYRQSSLRFVPFSNEPARFAALNIMLKANSLVNETAGLLEILNRLKDLEDKA
jgi:hypothetical protein